MKRYVLPHLILLLLMATPAMAEYTVTTAKENTEASRASVIKEIRQELRTKRALAKKIRDNGNFHGVCEALQDQLNVTIDGRVDMQATLNSLKNLGRSDTRDHERMIRKRIEHTQVIADETTKIANDTSEAGMNNALALQEIGTEIGRLVWQLIELDAKDRDHPDVDLAVVNTDDLEKSRPEAPHVAPTNDVRDLFGPPPTSGDGLPFRSPIEEAAQQAINNCFDAADELELVLNLPPR